MPRFSVEYVERTGESARISEKMSATLPQRLAPDRTRTSLLLRALVGGLMNLNLRFTAVGEATSPTGL